MDYKITILNSKKSLLNDFILLEAKYKTQRGETRWISLHSKYDVNTGEFWDNEIDIYLRCEEETSIISHFLKKWNFKKVHSLPEKMIFLVGNYNGSLRYFDSVFVY